MLNLATERGRALQDKQREIQQLGKGLESAEKARQGAGKHLAEEAAERTTIRRSESSNDSSKAASRHTEDLCCGLMLTESTVRIYRPKKKR